MGYPGNWGSYSEVGLHGWPQFGHDPINAPVEGSKQGGMRCQLSTSCLAQLMHMQSMPNVAAWHLSLGYVEITVQHWAHELQ